MTEKIRLLIADDEEFDSGVWEEYFQRKGYDVVVAKFGDEAIRLWEKHPADVGIIDYFFPQGPNGIEVVRRILDLDPWATLIMVTGYESGKTEHAVDVLKAGASDFLSKPVSLHEMENRILDSLLRVRERRNQTRKYEKVTQRKGLFKTCIVLSKALESKSRYTQGHSQRVSDYAQLIARQMGREEDVLALERIGLLHDIGKIGIPDSILNANRKLTADEWKVMHKHPMETDRILSVLFEWEPALRQAAKHHMKVNGNGYPEGKPQKGELCLIIAVADAVDAMFSERPYRKGMSKDDVIVELEHNKEKNDWDQDVVDACLALIEEDLIPIHRHVEG